MKQIALWLALTLLPACCVFAGASRCSSNQGETVNKLEHSSVALVHFVDGEGHEVNVTDITGPDDPATKATLVTYCTGVWVSNDVFLTAEHCVDDIGKPKTVTETTDDEDESPEDELQDLLQQLQKLAAQKHDWTPINQPVMYSTRNDISPTNKAYHSSKVIAVDMADDMVLVKADVPGHHPFARVARGEIYDGTELHLIGNEAGMWWSYRHGYVASHRPAYTDQSGKTHDILQVSAPVFFGDSGGGAFNLDGDLVGMADSISRVPSVAFYVHRDVIRGFLEHEQIIPPVR